MEKLWKLLLSWYNEFEIHFASVVGICKEITTIKNAMQANMSSSFKKGDCISADSEFSNITK